MSALRSLAQRLPPSPLSTRPTPRHIPRSTPLLLPTRGRQPETHTTQKKITLTSIILPLSLPVKLKSCSHTLHSPPRHRRCLSRPRRPRRCRRASPCVGERRHDHQFCAPVSGSNLGFCWCITCGCGACGAGCCGMPMLACGCGAAILVQVYFARGSI